MKDLWEIEFLYKRNDLVLNLDIHNWSGIVMQLPDIHWSSVGAHSMVKVTDQPVTSV